MSIIPEVRAVKQLKQYYQLMKEAQDSMRGGGKRKKGGTRHKNLGHKINELQRQISTLQNRIVVLQNRIGDKRSGKHKNLGHKINELQKKINDLNRINYNLMRKIHNNKEDVQEAYNLITNNEQSIGTIRSYINYKLDETHKPVKNDNINPPLEIWTKHLVSLHNRNDRVPLEEEILRDAVMTGGRKSKSRKSRKSRKSHKRRSRNNKTRRKKSR